MFVCEPSKFVCRIDVEAQNLQITVLDFEPFWPNNFLIPCIIYISFCFIALSDCFIHRHSIEECKVPLNVCVACVLYCWHKQSISDWIVAHDTMSKNQHTNTQCSNWTIFNYACMEFCWLDWFFERKQIDYVTTPNSSNYTWKIDANCQCDDDKWMFNFRNWKWLYHISHDIVIVIDL